MVDLSLDPGADVGGAFHPGQVSIEDNRGYPRGGLNLDLQDVRLRREEYFELQLLGSNLVGDRACSLDKHFIGYAFRVRGVDGHADGREDIQVVGLGRQERLSADVHRRKLHTTSIDYLSSGPGVSVLGQTFMFLDRVGKGKDNWPLVDARHGLDDFPRE